jgi:exopolyphosphatase/guanosine-5'-triphosphate,3'-diphosphate pyrophosphatase
MQAFKMLMHVYQVDVYRACATSAMRDAKNGKALIKAIKSVTDIEIDIISGQEEATIIYNAHLGEKNNAQKTLLYIDVGGGSTELSLFHDNKLVQKESFNIGTIRLLQNQVNKAHWQELARFLKAISKKYDQVQLVGSGGNINKLFSLSKQKEGKPLSKATLSSYYDSLSAMSIEERMHHYDLREDRADVMLPALSIFLKIMEHMQSKEIFVPKIGLADGIVRSIYYQESL